MANMELVIKISEEDYKTLVNVNDSRLPSIIAREHLFNAIATSVSLPKGHGRLIDEDTLWFEDIANISCVTQRNVENSPTIIEADKGEDDKC